MTSGSWAQQAAALPLLLDRSKIKENITYFAINTPLFFIFYSPTAVKFSFNFQYKIKIKLKTFLIKKGARVTLF